VWAAVILFIAMSGLWLSQDTRVLDWDSGAHMYYAYLIHAQWAQGQFTHWFTDFNTYPPLVHVLGAITTYIAGLHPDALILSANIVFVPLMAFGCFGVGRIVYGPRAGLLAALFALGSPMFVSMMHEYDLDPPQAALVAVTVWAVLSSKRFERLGISALAGLLAGLALMTKETSVVFLGGFLLVVVIRGGWRNWIGLIIFLFVLENVAGPWYIYHWHDIKQAFDTLGGQAGLPVSSIQTPPRFSTASLGWYWWDLVNIQILLPFAIAFLVGAGWVAWRWVRKRLPSGSFEPDLLAGAVLSYVGMTLLTHKDPRYTLPALVFVAVIATGWITKLRSPRWRTGLSWAIVALAAVYLFGLSLGIGGPVRIPLPNPQNSLINQRQLTLYDPTGYVRGGPQQDGDVGSLLEGLKSKGIRDILLYTGPDPVDFNMWGMQVMLESHHMLLGPTSTPASQTAYLLLTQPAPYAPPPCQTIDHYGLYVVQAPAPGLTGSLLRNPANPKQRYAFLCPGRPTVMAP
jgi:4-amino-4-deoxy-L-arabinose transferase-like glycosyltransferase